MISRIGVLLLIAIALRAQTVDIHVTATPQDRSDTNVAFGRLGNHVAVAADICLGESASLKIPTARVRQAVRMPIGFTLLPAAIASSVIQDAQGRAPLATTARVLGGLAGGAGAAVAIKAIPPSGWGSSIILGGEAASIVLQFIFPALQTHAVISAGGLLPEVLDFDPSEGGCVSGIVLVTTPRKAPLLGTLDQTVTVLTAATVAQ